MQVFYDTEFLEQKTEDGIKLQLISIGAVLYDKGIISKFYKISKSFNIQKAFENTWLVKNVLKKIYPYEPFNIETFSSFINANGLHIFEIGNEFTKWLNSYLKPEEKDKEGIFTMYGYYADFDHMMLASMYGGMLNMPKILPMYTTDLKQMMDFYGLSTDWKRLNVPTDDNEHSAIADAEWNVKLYEKILNSK